MSSHLNATQHLCDYTLDEVYAQYRKKKKKVTINDVVGLKYCMIAERNNVVNMCGWKVLELVVG